MKTKTVNIVDALHIDVFVEMNDYADIKCGGPPTLGYDFYVAGDMDVDKLKKFVADTLKAHNRYYQNISIRKVSDFREDKLWTLSKIVECIKKTQVA